MRRFIQFMTHVLISTGCTVTYHNHGNNYRTHGHYLLVDGHTQPQCEARCTADRKCASYSYNSHKNQCSISERADSQYDSNCGLCTFANKKCTSDCAITYHNHGIYHRTNSFYKSYSDYTLAGCETTCTADSSCAGFGYNSGTTSCYMSARSDPQDFLSCSACTFHTKQCRTVQDTTTTIKPTTTTSLESATEGMPSTTSVFSAQARTEASAIDTAQARTEASAIETATTMTDESISKTDGYKAVTTIVTPTTTMQSESTTQAPAEASATETVVTVLDESTPTTEEYQTVSTGFKPTTTFSSGGMTSIQYTSTAQERAGVSTVETVMTASDESSSTTKEYQTVSTVFTPTTTTSTRGTTSIQYASTAQARVDVGTTETVRDESPSITDEYKTVTNTAVPSSNTTHETPPTTIINYVFGKSTITCSCTCNEVNITIQEQIWQRKKELQLKVEKLSSRKRKYYSASDPRPSSKTIGTLGAIILGLICAVIVIPDILNLVQWIMKSVKDL